MKKILTIMLLGLFAFSLLAEPVAGSRTVNHVKNRQEIALPSVNKARATLLNEDFENEAFPPSGWTIVDADGDGHSWGQPPEAQIPYWAYHSGSKVATSASYIEGVGAVTPDNWLITKTITLPADSAGFIDYWVCAEDSLWSKERYGVYISENSINPADFTLLFEETVSSDKGPTAWNEKIIAIPASYSGKTVNIAFRHFNCTNWFYLNIDDVKILSGSNPDIYKPECSTPLGVNVNAGQIMNVSVEVSDVTGIASVVGHYQLNGQSTWTDFQLAASKTTNTYTGTIPAQSGSASGKVKFTTTDTVNPPNSGDSPEFDIFWRVSGIYNDGEGFEESFPPAGWTVVDLDGGGRNWDQAIAAPYYPVHLGNKAAFHKYPYPGTGTQEGLLITPKSHIGASNPKLTFWQYDYFPGGYVYHGIMVSTTNTDPSSFSELQAIPASTMTWTQKQVDLSAYAGQNVYIAFKYTGHDTNYVNAWYIDDVKIDGMVSSDTEPPVVSTPTGLMAAPGVPLNITTVVSDVSGIASVSGKYKLTGQTTWTAFAMTATKAEDTYSGTIPAQAAAISGKVKFIVADSATPVNSSETQEYDIKWLDGFTVIEWGSNYDAASCVGVTNGPWFAGIDYNFGDKQQYFLNKIELGLVSSYGAVDVPWKVVSVDQVDPTTIANLGEIGNLDGTIYCAGTNPLTTNYSVVENSTPLTGHIALLLSMPIATYVPLDVNATSDHTYINVPDDETLKTLQSLSPTTTGAWFMRMYVSTTTGIDNESLALLPGKTELLQNYPNPFNPETAIKFYSSLEGNVKLTVLNAKGEFVTSLINGKLNAGNHSAVFNGVGLNSGVYFYKLETPNATITKKMLLIK